MKTELNLALVGLLYSRKGHIEDRFERSYIPEPNSGCWIWLGAVAGRDDRPRFRENGIQVYASYTSWRQYKGEVPAGLQILHRCDNPLCVNPDHLFLGTQQDNVQDMVAKGRHAKIKP